MATTKTFIVIPLFYLFYAQRLKPYILWAFVEQEVEFTISSGGTLPSTTSPEITGLLSAAKHMAISVLSDKLLVLPDRLSR